MLRTSYKRNRVAIKPNEKKKNTQKKITSMSTNTNRKRRVVYLPTKYIHIKQGMHRVY